MWESVKPIALHLFYGSVVAVAVAVPGILGHVDWSTLGVVGAVLPAILLPLVKSVEVWARGEDGTVDSSK